MGSLVAWAGEDGRRIESYGLDLIPSLTILARRRLPRWTNRIFTGNVMTWRPPLRFDFVRAELEYVPRHRRQDMVERLLCDYLLPKGRLILCSYSSSCQSEPKAESLTEVLRSWGHEVTGQAEGRDTNGVVITRVAWTD